MTFQQLGEMTAATIDDYFNQRLGNSREATMVVEVAHVLGVSGAYHTSEYVHFPKDHRDIEALMRRALDEGRRLYRSSF